MPATVATSRLVLLNVRFTTNGMCAKHSNYVARTSNNSDLVGWVDYCVKLRALAARDFRSQRYNNHALGENGNHINTILTMIIISTQTRNTDSLLDYHVMHSTHNMKVNSRRKSSNRSQWDHDLFVVQTHVLF